METLRRIAAGEMSADAVQQSTPARSGSQQPPGGTESQDEELERARAIVLRQLTAAPRSRKQLEDKLAQRDVAPQVAAAVLDRMESVGLVDDEAYARMLVRSQQQGRGLARRGLAHELRTKGVDDEIAQGALSEEVDPAAERARAEELVAKRLRTMSGLGRQVKTRRLAGMLARKGYPGELTFQVIREALDQDPEHRRD